MRDGDEQIPFRQPANGSLRPFDDGDPIVRVGEPIEPETLEIAGGVEAIEVEMMEPDGAPIGGSSFMFGDQTERRARDRPGYPKSGGDALREGCLAGAEIAMQEQHVTGAQTFRQAHPELAHRRISPDRERGAIAPDAIDEHGQTIDRVGRYRYDPSPSQAVTSASGLRLRAGGSIAG